MTLDSAAPLGMNPAGAVPVQNKYGAGDVSRAVGGSGGEAL